MSNPETYQIIVIDPSYNNEQIFIDAISEIEAPDYIPFGRIAIDDCRNVYFFSTPKNRRIDFIWEMISDKALGFIIIIDGVDPGTFRESRSMVESFRAYCHLPYIIAANHHNSPDVWPIDDLRIVLRIPEFVPIVPFDLGDRESVKNVVLELLYCVLAELASQE
ncbi:MAG: GTP-binding protein [Anaerolineae bacterium]|nr:GTP-binding protein [Anaerolineae bacterium]